MAELVLSVYTSVHQFCFYGKKNFLKNERKKKLDAFIILDICALSLDSQIW